MEPYFLDNFINEQHAFVTCPEIGLMLISSFLLRVKAKPVIAQGNAKESIKTLIRTVNSFKVVQAYLHTLKNVLVKSVL